MEKTEVIYLSASELLALFTNKQLSPVELIQAFIQRIELVEPHINATTEQYFESALAQAKVAEQAYVQGDPRPLEGIPLAVKDEFRLAGTRRTSSSLVYENRVDSETDVIIQRLLDAGAICLTKTTTPEFCLLGSCHSRLWGVTRNPWDIDLTPGGSSGGSGAVLAAGMATIATGTDIGGSIRIPAAQCGVVGYKPPYGRNPEIPVFNLDFYSHSGPMARSSQDIALMQNIISGPHNKDIASLREIVQLETEKFSGDLREWKIAYSEDLGFMEVDRDVSGNMHTALKVFEELGATIEPVTLGWTEDIIEAVHSYWAFNWATTMLPLMQTHRDQLTDYAIFFMENAQKFTPSQYARSLEVAVEMYDEFGPMMDRYDLFVCPTLATNQIPAEFTWPRSQVTINGIAKDWIEERWSMTYPFNVLSRCPVIQLPSGLGHNGVPTGIQLVGRTFDDEKVMTAARAFESVTGQMNYQLDSRIT